MAPDTKGGKRNRMAKLCKILCSVLYLILQKFELILYVQEEQMLVFMR